MGALILNILPMLFFSSQIDYYYLVNFIITPHTPVSYTHLDVYKRQPLRYHSGT